MTAPQIWQCATCGAIFDKRSGSCSLCEGDNSVHVSHPWTSGDPILRGRVLALVESVDRAAKAEALAEQPRVSEEDAKSLAGYFIDGNPAAGKRWDDLVEIAERVLARLNNQAQPLTDRDPGDEAVRA
jgi:hypothetical protein